MRYFSLTPHCGRYIFFVGFVVFFFGVAFSDRAFALTVSPVRFEVGGDPGQVLVGNIDLFNEQDETKIFYASTANFEARGDSGAPYFLPERKGLAVWISVEEQVTLAAGERKSVPYTISIPADADAGGHFAAIFWGTSPPAGQGTGQVAVGGKLGMLILLSVTGELKEGGGLLGLTIDENRKVVNSLPVYFFYRFSNDGNERVKPIGELKIKNLFGFTTVTMDANRRDGNILPGSVRKFEVVWFEKKQDEKAVFTPPQEVEGDNKESFLSIARKQWGNFAFGMYTAHLSLAYGKDDTVANTSYRFFVVPWQLLIIICGILFIVGFFGIPGMKKYNRWVIRRASGEWGAVPTQGQNIPPSKGATRDPKMYDFSLSGDEPYQQLHEKEDTPNNNSIIQSQKNKWVEEAPQQRAKTPNSYPPHLSGKEKEQATKRRVLGGMQ